MVVLVAKALCGNDDRTIRQGQHSTQCSFCTIINVQGRKSRYSSADDVEHLVRLNWAQGIRKFFITDENFCPQQGVGIDL